MFAVLVKKGIYTYNVSFPWKVSIVAFMANPLLMKNSTQAAVETVEALARDPFFDMLEFNLLSDEVWSLIQPVIRNANLDVAVGLQPMTTAQGYNPAAVDEQTRRKAVEALSEAIKRSAERGITKVGFSSGADPGPENREAAKDALVKSLKELAALGGKYGVKLILETFDRDWDKKQLIGPIREAVEIVEEVRQEYSNIGLLWDLSHAPMLGEKPSDIRVAREYLFHIHIGCTKKLPDGRLMDWHPGFYRPGAINGVEDVAQLLSVLEEIGYTGAIGFEVKPEENQEWREVVEAAKGVLYTAFARTIR
ncbi:MAG: sugar phosphate isomerase/epimerase family protein [Infirmifilum sp.]